MGTAFTSGVVYITTVIIHRKWMMTVDAFTSIFHKRMKVGRTKTRLSLKCLASEISLIFKFGTLHINP